MARATQPILTEADLDRIKASLDDLQFARQRLAILHECGHDCDQYNAVLAEIERVLLNVQAFYTKERQLLAQMQASGG